MKQRIWRSICTHVQYFALVSLVVVSSLGLLGGLWYGVYLALHACLSSPAVSELLLSPTTIPWSTPPFSWVVFLCSVGVALYLWSVLQRVLHRVLYQLCTGRPYPGAVARETQEMYY